MTELMIFWLILFYLIGVIIVWEWYIYDYIAYGVSRGLLIDAVRSVFWPVFLSLFVVYFLGRLLCKYVQAYLMRNNSK